MLLFLINTAIVNAEEISVVSADTIWKLNLTDATSVGHLSGDPGVMVVKYADATLTNSLQGTTDIGHLSGEPGVIVVKYADAILGNSLEKGTIFGGSAPVLAPIGNKTVNVKSLLSFTILATDIDGDKISYSATGIPSGAAFDGSTGVFSWTPGTAGVYYVTFTAITNGQSDSEMVKITVTNNDWNPWNDPDSPAGELIALSELQEAIYKWRFGMTLTTGEQLNLSRLQMLIYNWRFGK